MKERTVIFVAVAALVTIGLAIPVEAQGEKSIFELGSSEAKYTPGGFKAGAGNDQNPVRQARVSRWLPDRTNHSEGIR